MATGRKPAIPPLRTTDLRELQAVISNIRERLDRLDAAVASASSSVGATTATTTSSASTAASADTADTLTTARAFDLAGVTTDGPHNFDGSSDVTIEVLEIPLALLEQDGAATADVMAWDGSQGWTPATLIDPMSPIDHGALMGLGDDDHPHYLNEARANDLYSVLGHTHDASEIAGLLANVLEDYGDMIVGQSGGAPSRLPIGLDDQVLKVVGGLPSWETQDDWTYLVLGSDHTNSTTTTSDVPTLQMLFGAAGSYEFEGRLLVQTASTAAMPRLTAYEPDNANGAWMITMTQGTTSVLEATGGTGATGGFTASGTARHANLPMLADVSAFYIATAAATTPWKMGLVSETAGQAVTVLAGSFIRWRKLP